jgi:hypothetical protein
LKAPDSINEASRFKTPIMQELSKRSIDETSDILPFRVLDKKILIKSSAKINYWAITIGKMFLLTTNYKTTVYTNRGDFF